MKIPPSPSTNEYYTGLEAQSQNAFLQAVKNDSPVSAILM